MKPLTDDHRKRLTLYLGECWHKTKEVWEDDHYDCAKCGGSIDFDERTHKIVQRKFSTIQDFYDLKVKLVENGEWNQFSQFARDRMPILLVAYDYQAENLSYESAAWLFRPESCGLVAEYLEQKEGK